MDTRAMLRQYLDSRTQHARYAAANDALSSVMQIWENWMHANLGPRLDKYARAPIWARDGVERWLEGNARVDALALLLPILEETHRRTMLASGPQAHEAALVSAAAMNIVEALVEETNGTKVHRDADVHVCDTVLAVAEINDRPIPGYELAPFVVRWMAHVDEYWPALQ